MPFDAQKALQLSALLSQHALMFTQNNPGQQAFAEQLIGGAQAGIQAEALKKARKAQEKKSKGALGGAIGSALGTAGILAAPFTGGLSLAATAGLGAAGGALGGLAGQYIAGGSPSGTDLLGYGAQGGLAGYNYGKAGQLAQTAQDGAVPPPPVGDQTGQAIANSMPDATQVLNDPLNLGLPNGTGMMRAPANSYGVTPGSGPVLQPGQQGWSGPPKQPGYFSRFGSALSQTSLAPRQPRFDYNQDGSVTYWN